MENDIGDVGKMQVKTIWRKAMQASRRGDYIGIEVIEAEYEGGFWELKQDLIQKNFDRWHFSGMNGDEDGILSGCGWTGTLPRQGICFYRKMR